MDNEKNISLDAAIINCSQHGIIVFDEDGTIVRSNVIAEQIITIVTGGGIALSEVEVLESFKIDSLEASQTQDRQEVNIGNKSILIARCRVSELEKNMIVYFLNDISGQKTQIAAIHQQTSDVLWNIRSRITSVQNALVLLSYGDVDADMQDLLFESRLEVWRISNYADKLRDFSLLNANALEKQMDIEEVDIKEAVAETMHNINTFAAGWIKNYEFIDQVPEKMIVRCDRQRSMRIIESVVTNAIGYADKKVAITFSANSQSDGITVLHIKDNGIGIPEGEQARVFSYGFIGSNVTNNEFKGMGISLYLARQIMNRMNGEISFESKEGVGSVFALVFIK
jgi:two-component system, OmpR family, phosphate regulon sensor histidine kinase PhoR